MNEDRTAERLTWKHKVGPSARKNIQKQAKQIRYALTQAREYYDAAHSVSNATKPLLLYYSAMCLAIAEFLWSGTGDVSFDRARAEHRSHGLELSFGGFTGDTLEEKAGALVAAPKIGVTGRSGTFELWHRTARQGPLVGTHTQISANGGQRSGLSALLSPWNVRMPELTEGGISLLDCMKLLPGMFRFIPHFGSYSDLVRSSVRMTSVEGRVPKHELVFITHPGLADRTDRAMNEITVDPNAVDHINLIELADGFGLKLRYEDFERYEVNFPESYCVDEKEIMLVPEGTSLNEFGVMYVGLYIAGMFCRYYPDFWMRELERDTGLALAIEHFVEVCSERMPLLALTALTRIVYLP